jgi:hypothetical protein
MFIIWIILFLSYYMFQSVKIIIKWFLLITYVVIELLKWIHFLYLAVFETYLTQNFNLKLKFRS